jgi:hypothetical protein
MPKEVIIVAKPTLADKDILTTAEAAIYFGLSAKKWYLFLEEGPQDFIAFYGDRKLIIKSDFEKYLAKPGVKEALGKNGRRKNKAG